MSALHHHRSELFRLAAIATALLLSWLEVWKLLAPFDFIALAATLVGGYPMFEEAYEAIRSRRMTMELSMAIAVVATLLIGQFFTGLVITFFVLFAELLEHLTVARGRTIIAKLVDLLPRSVRVRRDNEEREIDIAQLSLTDTIIIKPGARIPVDGIVLRGNSFVDQSSINGESLPVEKLEGHEVFAGTVNQTGVLEVEPTRIGSDTTFGKIIEIIEQAEKAKAPIQKTADKIAARLVYLAVGGAIATFLYTHDIVSAISALIVAGACGVAAGTPLAILAGIGRTAKEGIIVKGGVCLEQLSKVDTIVLDKTGTLTLGTPQVVHIQSFNGMQPAAVLRLAAIAEQHSEHPLAQAVLNKARENSFAITSYSTVEYLPGQGMVCRVNGDEVLVGNTSLLEGKSVSIDDAVASFISERKGSGETSIMVANNGQVVGAISMSDVIRAEAREAVSELKRIGCRVILLSGDSQATARAVGSTLHVDDVFGEMLPQQKLEKVRQLNAAGRRVAMVGDGVNDAPALVEASVGVAMGSGTVVALESADLALTTDNLMKIVDAVQISRQCMRVIMFNFWGTVMIDAAGIGLAFAGYLTPLFAALIHVVSELAFILNSARLFRK